MADEQKALVLYFFWSGNTKRAAQQVQRLSGADIEEIQPVVPYSSDYQAAGKRAEGEKDKAIHPEIRPLTSDLTAYDVIYVGFPTWWYQPPMIIHSLFEQNDFKGKRIIPFVTSASSSVTDSVPVLQQLATAAGAELEQGFTANKPRIIEKYFK